METVEILYKIDFKVTIKQLINLNFMEKLYQFYALSEESTPQNFRYIGVTSKEINQRFAGHKDCAMHETKSSCPVHKWMYSVYKKGGNIIYTKIAECSGDKWEETEKKLNEQLSARKAEVEKKTKIALSYKAKFESVVNKYIDTKASMLGIQSSEIRNRLTEQFSLEDVDKVCDEFLSNTRAAKLPFVGNSGTVMSESKVNQKFAISKNDDLYDLYELAGLN